MLACYHSSVQLGSVVSIEGILRDDSSNAGISMTQLNFTITDSGGHVFYEQVCGPSQTEIFVPGGSYACNVYWGTSIPYNGATPSAGTYYLYIGLYYQPTALAGTAEAEIQLIG
jgi:hypothetical protein